MAKKTYNCTEDGFCVIESTSNKPKINILKPKKKLDKIIYFGDPMCSWCWGISNDLEKLKNKYAGKYNFELVMGGLRPGGGDLWNDQMKNFLKHHWEQVHSTTGQPFNYDLLTRNEFDYDTEPACRAVRIIRDMAPELEFDFYREIQYKFYVKNEDPKSSDFYRSICADLKIPFKAFRPLFLSAIYCDIVKEDFKKSLDYGVRGFPAVILETKNNQINVCNGFATFDEMDSRIQKIEGEPIQNKKSKKKINIFGLFSF
jgi:putative protein-disulfide isomerase